MTTQFPLSQMDSQERQKIQEKQKIQADREIIARKLIEKYFFQLTVGCGQPGCKNVFCASSGKVDNLTGNQAAIKSLQLYSEQAKLCEVASPSSSSEATRVIRDVEMNEVPAAARQVSLLFLNSNLLDLLLQLNTIIETIAIQF